jgi:CubicO group peptidase (beta-lactamase class C family)
MSLSSLSYLKRYIFWNYSGINDYKKFPYKEISCERQFYSFNKDEKIESDAANRLKLIEYRYKNKTLRCSLDELLKSTGTTAFIIIKDDTILYEEYLSKHLRESINTSFSTSKSFTSALTGIAIDEGYIKSLNDKVIEYIPELENKVSNELSIRHLITMSSGIEYNHSHYPWADEAKSYHYPDLEKLVFGSTKQEYQPGKYFKYSNFNTILLGMILNRATNYPPYEYLQNKIWKPLRMEFPATWSTDSKEHNFPKMESGINARSIDYAKFGRLFLNSGRWDNKQIISEKWIKESTTPLDMMNKEYYILKNYYPYSMFFKDKQLYYKYGWWGLKKDEEHYDYMAIGHLGQFIYVCPQKRMIIVRNGSGWGQINWWPALFKSIAEML